MAKECWPPCEHIKPAEMSRLEVGCSVGSRFLMSVKMRRHGFVHVGGQRPRQYAGIQKADAFGQRCRSDPVISSRNRQHLHQVVEGSVCSGARKRHEEKHKFSRLPNGIMFNNV